MVIMFHGELYNFCNILIKKCITILFDYVSGIWSPFSIFTKSYFYLNKILLKSSVKFHLFLTFTSRSSKYNKCYILVTIIQYNIHSTNKSFIICNKTYIHNYEHMYKYTYLYNI